MNTNINKSTKDTNNQSCPGFIKIAASTLSYHTLQKNLELIQTLLKLNQSVASKTYEFDSANIFFTIFLTNIENYVILFF